MGLSGTKKAFRYFTLAFASLSVLSAQARSAEFIWKGADLYIVGPIKEGDRAQFIYSLSNKKELPRSVKLRSPGGLISEALQIGRLLRNYRLVSNAPTIPLKDFHCSGETGDQLTQDGNCICVSACALIWSGGVIRFGSVGIHRSYLLKPGASFDDYENDLQRSHGQIENYLEEMRVPQWVKDSVLQTSSEDLAIISAATPTEPFGPWRQEPIMVDPIFQEYALSLCGDTNTAIYENMGCYIEAVVSAQEERDDARWFDTAQTYLSAYPALSSDPYLAYFDNEVRDITGSEEYMEDAWLDQLGRADWRTAARFTEIMPPNWWVKTDE